ncbi:MAG: hypothetical protein WBN09_12730 [Woeseiaceae bacterium]
MRPGTKVSLWSPKFTNHPDVEPPFLLKFTGAVAVFSVVAFLAYAVKATLGYDNSTPAEAAYVAILHFVLPVCILYTIHANSPISRIAIAAYAVTMGIATTLGKGLLGSLPIEEAPRVAASVTGLLIVLTWLFASPKMRYYYAVISNRPIPDDLRGRADELQGGVTLGRRARAALEWFVDSMETVVLVGFIVAVIVALLSTT